MAHFARINQNNRVVAVLVMDNNHEDGREGAIWLDMNMPGRWVKTSYNTIGNQHRFGGQPFRGNYAGIGFIYDEENDVFYEPQPFASWILNKNTWIWESPVPYPEDGNMYKPESSIRYFWNENNQSWDRIGSDA